MSRLVELARSLEARTVAVMLVAVLAVHGGALLIYRQSAVAAAEEAFASEVAKQLALAREALMRRPPAERPTEAQALSAPHFEIGWAAASPLAVAEDDVSLASLRDRVQALAPSLGNGLRLAPEAPDDPIHREDLRGALALPDGSYLTFRSAHAPPLTGLRSWTLLATAMTILVGAAAVLLMHRIAGPLRALAGATRRIGLGERVPVPERGPDETREIGRSLNVMQERIHGLLAERTQALAAVSHDLRTPLARLRLRVDAMRDAAQGQAMAGDLADMEAMIDATLAYLRGEEDPEPRRMTNVASLLLSVADAAADAGQNVAYDGPARALALVRPVALRRAIENLVENAVRYGVRARLSLLQGADALMIQVDDDGPGIPPEDFARACEPFVRLEGSRNRATGGTGLGLAIASRTIKAEGGSLTLAAGPGGGLRATLTVPGAAPLSQPAD